MRLRLILLTSLLAGLPLSGVAAPTLPGVGAAMQAQVDAQEIAGAVTLVTTKDKVIHLEATGFSRVLPEAPMRTDSLFLLASVSKMFTGVAVLMLQDEGRLDVNDPVAKYLPEFVGLRTATGEPAEITIAQLLTHTSGLRDIERSTYARASDLAGVLAAQRPLAPPVAPPGRQWSYNEFGYDVAGRIVEVVSGQPFDEFLSTRLLGPLGMHDTTFYPSEAQQRRLAGLYEENRRTGALELRTTWSGLPLPVRGCFPPVPGGGLFSTAADLARFCQMLLQRGELDRKRYLSERAFQLLTTIRTGSEPPGPRGWGLGPYVIRGPGEGLASRLSPGSYGHPGATGCQLIVDPERGRGYVLLLQRRGLPGGWDNRVVDCFLESANRAIDAAEPAGAGAEGKAR